MILYYGPFCSYLYYMGSGQVKRIFDYDCCMAMHHILFAIGWCTYDEFCGINGQN